MQYLGYNVFDVRDYVDVSADFLEALTWRVNQYQFDSTHPMTRIYESFFPSNLIELKVEVDALDSYAYVRDFFKDVCGALYAFWLLAPFTVFELVEALSGDDATLTIRDVGYAAHFLGATGTFRHAFVSDGTSLNARKIESAVDGEESDVLTLDAALDIDAADIEDTQLFPLFFCRFADDQLTSEWPELARHAGMSLKMVELPEDYPS